MQTHVNDYLYGKGKVALMEREANGAVSKALYVGDCPELKISMTTETIKNVESTSGLNVENRNVVKSIGMEFSMTLKSITKENLAVLTWGVNTAIAAAPSSSHFFPEGIVAGDIHIVPNGFNISSPVLKDSAGSPATVDTADYEIDTDFGSIKFNDVAGYTQPFELEYDRGAADSVPFFTGTRPVRFIRFEGINLGNPGSANDKFIVEIYNGAMEPVADLGLITDDFGSFELKGAGLLDETRESNAALGGFGRIIKL